MSQPTPALLQRALFETLEVLCFALAEPQLEEDVPMEAPEAVVRVGFQGRAHGTLCIEIGGGAMGMLAESMLGEGGDTSLSEQQDAMKELANVTCGTLMPLWSGDGAVFDLSMPELVENATEPGPGAVRASLAVEDGWARISFELEGPRGA